MNIKILMISVTCILSTCMIRAGNISMKKIKKHQKSVHSQEVKLKLDDVVQTISLDGEWKYKKTTDEDMSALENDHEDGWQSVDVPSNWFLNGTKSYPLNDRSSDYHGTMWYEREIFIPDSYKGKCLSLNLSMVDYFSDIFLNGAYVGSHEGYFQDFSFPVEDKLIYGKDNTILIRVNSPKSKVDFEGNEKKSWPKYQYLVKGVYGFHDARPGSASERGQEGNTGGIVGGVSLHISDALKINSMQIETHINKEHTKAIIKVDLSIDNRTEQRLEGLFEYEINSENFEEKSSYRGEELLQLDPEINKKRIEIVIEKPRLWWTWDHGFPNLYRINCKITKDRRLLDKKTEVFGIRSFRIEDGWKCYLNNKNIFIRGSNYISSQWLSEMDNEKYKKDVMLMKKANLNSIRVHAHIEKKEFYETADRIGVLIWQDFPLQWGYTDADDFRVNAVRQASEMVTGLFNHPSIVIWCSHNESPWGSAWMEKKEMQQNRFLDEAIYKKISSLDKTRFTHMNSGSGDGHPYKGWYEGIIKEYRNIPEAPFISEYGAQGLPGIETLSKMFPKDALFPETDKDWKLWEYHNFQKDPTFSINRVKMGENIEDFILSSQKYQAKLIKFATENYRKEKGKMQGLYHFMFVDCWPAITWAVLDYYRNPKLGYYALKESMQPVLPSIIYDELGNFEIWIVNDLYKEFKNAKLKWEIKDKNGTMLNEEILTINISENSTERATHIGNLKQLMIDGGELSVQIYDRNGEIIAKNKLENWQWVDRPIALILKKPFKFAYSSTEYQNNVALCAIDGNPQTRWESVHGSDDEWLIVELENEKVIDKITIRWEFASAEKYDVLISRDGEDWELVESVVNGQAGETRVVELKAIVKFIKIHCQRRTTEWGNSIWEIDIE